DCGYCKLLLLVLGACQIFPDLLPFRAGRRKVIPQGLKLAIRAAITSFPGGNRPQSCFELFANLMSLQTLSNAPQHEPGRGQALDPVVVAAGAVALLVQPA